MTQLPHRLDRTIVIRAAHELVFSFFTDDARWASWWGAGSTIDPQPGGRVYIRYPGNVEVAGEVLEIVPSERIVFTYGFVSGKPIGPGTSRVTIRVEPHGHGTRVSVSHEFAEAGVRDEHVQGWRYQLSVFGNVVSDLVNAGATALVDGWFSAWSAEGEPAVASALAAVATPSVQFRDRYSLIDGRADLVPHILAAQRFMPGIRTARRGDVRHCQGTLLVDWVATGADQAEKASGTNVFSLNASGLIDSATGFWGPPRPA